MCTTTRDNTVQSSCLPSLMFLRFTPIKFIGTDGLDGARSALNKALYCAYRQRYSTTKKISIAAIFQLHGGLIQTRILTLTL